jgi:predicted RNase H-like HicB family nuclease
MKYQIEFEQEQDGRWIAEIAALPGVMAYGSSRIDAESRVEVMALRVIADYYPTLR